MSHSPMISVASVQSRSHYSSYAVFRLPLSWDFHGCPPPDIVRGTCRSVNIDHFYCYHCHPHFHHHHARRLFPRDVAADWRCHLLDCFCRWGWHCSWRHRYWHWDSQWHRNLVRHGDRRQSDRPAGCGCWCQSRNTIDLRWNCPPYRMTYPNIPSTCRSHRSRSIGSGK